MQNFNVLQASNEQEERLRELSEKSYTVGLMDRLVVQMSVEQLREAHDDPVLKETKPFADDVAIIEPVE